MDRSTPHTCLWACHGIPPYCRLHLPHRLRATFCLPPPATATTTWTAAAATTAVTVTCLPFSLPSFCCSTFRHAFLWMDIRTPAYNSLQMLPAMRFRLPASAEQWVQQGYAAAAPAPGRCVTCCKFRFYYTPFHLLRTAFWVSSLTSNYGTICARSAFWR